MLGQTLSIKYEVGSQVSDGPVFAMFAARDRLTGRNVGIRQIKMPFNAEAEFLSALVNLIPQIQVNHPNVEAIYEIIEDSGQHYLITELPKGSLLLMRQRPKWFRKSSGSSIMATRILLRAWPCSLCSCSRSKLELRSCWNGNADCGAG